MRVLSALDIARGMVETVTQAEAEGSSPSPATSLPEFLGLKNFLGSDYLSGK